MAAINAIYVPLKLEREVLTHSRAKQILHAVALCDRNDECWAALDLGLPINPFAGLTAAQCPSTEPLKGYTLLLSKC